jgi:2-polyprenyl-3-methyl-5-hydroxy-6-metoxy-1,4-benzoquinol methylase
VTTGIIQADHHFNCNICRHNRCSQLRDRVDRRSVVSCDQCGMGVLQNIPEDLSIFYGGDYYNAGVGEGKDGYSNYEFTAEHSLLWVKLCVKYLRDSGDILDVGCADGHLLAELPRQFNRYGIEANLAASLQASRRGIQVISNDLFSLAGREEWVEKFDIITSIATFEHLKDFRGGVELCLRLLKEDGVLLFEVPLISDWANNDTWFSSSLEHVYYPTLQGLEWLLSNEMGAYFAGGEVHIKGFASNFIGFVTRNESTFRRIKNLYEVLTRSNLSQLSDEECALNLAFNVGHAFDVTPDRVLMLPKLLKTETSFHFLTRLTHLWHADALASAQLRWALETLNTANEYGSRQSDEVVRLIALSRDLEQRVTFLENKLRETARLLPKHYS